MVSRNTSGFINTGPYSQAGIINVSVKCVVVTIKGGNLSEELSHGLV